MSFLYFFLGGGCLDVLACRWAKPPSASAPPMCARAAVSPSPLPAYPACLPARRAHARAQKLDSYLDSAREGSVEAMPKARAQLAGTLKLAYDMEAFVKQALL